MKAYKIMRSQHHRTGVKVPTAKYNYGKRISGHRPTLDLIQAVIDLSKQHGLSFGEILVMCIGFKHGGFPRVPANLPLSSVRDLIGLANGSMMIQSPQFSATFWELLYEQIRDVERPNCPSRLESYFAFRDLSSLHQYRRAHWSDKMGDKLMCKIDILDCPVCFEADMVILDRIDENMTYETSKPQILRYWDQEKSDQPIIELLLQGTVALGDVVSK